MATHSDNFSKLLILSRLEEDTINPEKREQFEQDHGKILGLMDIINRTDIPDHIEPLTHPASITLALRKDEVKDSPIRQTILESAPQQQGDMILVPKVIETEE